MTKIILRYVIFFKQRMLETTWKKLLTLPEI